MLPLLIPPIFAFSEAWVAEDNDRELSELVEKTRNRVGYTRKVMADHMKLSEKQYSDQITLKHPLNAYRLWKLPLEWKRAFVIVLAERVAIQVVEDAKLQLVMRALDQLQVRMLRMELRRKEARERKAV